VKHIVVVIDEYAELVTILPKTSARNSSAKFSG